ncbi:MAG: glycosyltransferase [Treponema sp.]|nr:glycosyltransferase [Treponema sp.]
MAILSVIIPVYNAEAHLTRCLDSLLSQTFPDFECILINDGSADGTPGLCDAYAARDSRFRVFHQQNQGTSQSRRFGLSQAQGDYIVFVDSDDWVEPGYLGAVKDLIDQTNPDCIFFDFFQGTGLGKERYQGQGIKNLSAPALTQGVLEGRVFSCLWNIIFKSDFFRTQGVQFSPGINYGEDTLFVLDLLLAGPKISYLPRAFYHFCLNEASFTRKEKKPRFTERLLFLKALEDRLNHQPRYKRHNFFPMNDKYEMLCSREFSRIEYKTLYTPALSFFYLRRGGLRKFFILALAETWAYYLARALAVLLRSLRN